MQRRPALWAARRCTRRGLLPGLLLGLLACAGAPSTKPHLFLVVVDTLRADHLGVYGYGRPTSPHFDELAQGGLLFRRAFAPSSWTKPSVGSLFTSRWPAEHGAVAFHRSLSPDLPTLAERLGEAGYRTLGVSANFVHVNTKAGFSRGFESWQSFSIPLESDDPREVWMQPKRHEERIGHRAPNAREVNRALLEKLPPPGEAPVFAYLHYMDPHSPYAPPEALRLAFQRDPDTPNLATNRQLIAAAAGEPTGIDPEGLVDLYDAEIASVDRAFGELMAELRRRGHAANAVVVLVSDHGEEFGEHGGWFHGLTLHRESLSVPLVIRDFREAGQGVQRDEPVDLLDVPTTLLALAGVPGAADMRGRDLRRPLAPRNLVAQLHPDPPFERAIRTREQRVALLGWPWKAIGRTAGPPLLYQLEGDPGETRPLDPEASGQADLLEELASFAPGEAEDRRDATELKAAEREALRALGYLR